MTQPKPTVTTSEPWKESIPYLLGTDKDGKALKTAPADMEGIFTTANKQFMDSKFSPEMQASLDKQTAFQNDIINNRHYQSMWEAGDKANRGGYDPNVTRIGDTTGVSYVPDTAGVGRIANTAGVSYVDDTAGVDRVANTAGVGPLTGYNSRLLQGGLDPTNALSSLLGGTPNNPYLDRQANAITGMMTRNLNENVMPDIRSGAIAAGQYGGSRQGIAEGLAASRMNQDLAPALANLYGGAYENAQQRMAGAATGINEQAANFASQNAANTIGNQQFNTDIGFQNRGNDLRTQEYNAGIGFQNRGNDLRTQEYNANLGLQNRANDLNTQQFNADIGFRNNANDLNTQQFNANLGLQNRANDLNTQQFNSNLGLQNNQQEMARSAQSMQNVLDGAQLTSGGIQGQQTQYANMQALLGLPADYDWNNLSNYAGMIYPGAGMGGTQTQRGGGNIGADIMGMATGLGGMAMM